MITDRAETIACIKERVAAKLSNSVEERDCVAVSIAAMLTRDRDELFGMLLNKHLSKIAIQCADDLCVTKCEWRKLFGKDAVFTTEASAASLIKQNVFQRHADAISGALKCSLTEPVIQTAWQKATNQISCYLLYSLTIPRH